MSILNGKKVIIIGDRDGVPGPAIEECVKTAGADVVYSASSEPPQVQWILRIRRESKTSLISTAPRTSL